MASERWWFVIKWVVVVAHLIIGDEGGEVVSMVDVEYRDEVV